jgi:hypothetical protein
VSLEDEAHAAMVEALVRWLPSQLAFDGEVHAEVPYSYYGQRGSIDVVTYDCLSGRSLRDPDCTLHIGIYEVWSTVLRLEEVLRKLNEKVEVFPKYVSDQGSFRASPDMVSGNLVLLNTMHNVQVVREHLATFRSVFAVEEDRAARRQKPLVCKSLYLFSPLRGVPWEPLRRTPVEPRTSPECVRALEGAWEFVDSHEFLQAYRARSG